MSYIIQNAVRASHILLFLLPQAKIVRQIEKTATQVVLQLYYCLFIFIIHLQLSNCKES